VPGYRVGDWEALAYEERFLYDAWDKQASLVLMRDWPQRRVYHAWHKSWWDERIFQDHPEAVETVLTELRERGPLTSSAFRFQVRNDAWRGSWYGPNLTKNVLRALWHTGRVLTHGRRGGHHIYDLAERVVPPELYGAAPLREREMAAWLIRSRHRAVGLLRPNSSPEVWSLGLSSAERRDLIATLVASGELAALTVDGVRFHALPEILAGLETARPAKHMVFVAPLDQLMWDRKAVSHLFGFDYVWEVYVPEAKRRWGYYVLPVFYGERFVARFDSRLRDGVWHVHNWFWEPDVTPDADMLAALADAARRFVMYLGTTSVAADSVSDSKTRAVLKGIC
jgi:uncharacterized protein YcaQ